MHKDDTTSAVRIPITRYINGTYRQSRNPETEVVAYAVVDRRDAALVGRFRWSIQKARDSRTLYAQRGESIGGKCAHISMHEMIWERRNGPVPEGMTIDHKDHDGLNNRSSNLRLATKAEQSYNQRTRLDNSSGFKGVYWSKQLQAYRADIRYGQRFHLGQYPTAVEAGWVYNAAARRLFRDFACPNPIPEDAIGEDRKAEILATLESRYFPLIEAAIASGSAERLRTVRPDCSGADRVRRDSATGFNGVSPDQHTPGMFRATIRLSGKLCYLGTYPTKEEAAVVRDHIAVKLQGDKARLNSLPANAVGRERRAELIASVEARYLPRVLASLAKAESTAALIRADGKAIPSRVRYDSSTGYRGVTKEAKSRPYRASIRHAGKLRSFGNYATAEEAAVAFNAASPHVLGSRAVLNVIPDGSVTADRIAEITAIVESKLVAYADA